MTEYDDETGEPLPDDSRTIAKALAEANGFGHLWESYHPVVKQTIEWLEERGYLAIVDLAEGGS